jgi:hypothetical protein
MQSDHSVAALADDGGQATYDIPRPGTDRHRAVRQALADALALARLQTVVRCHAELDHVMARMAETEEVRVGRRAVAAVNDLACAGCGAAAAPVYELPRLLGYRCTHCGWKGDDPAALDEQKRAEALGQARVAVERAVERVGDALAVLGQRGKKAKEEGVTKLRELQADLAALDKCLRKAR